MRIGVVELEVLLDVLRGVHEVDDHWRGLAGVDAVQPGQGLHRGDPGEDLVDVHRHEPRLVEARLELISDDEHPIDPLLAEGLRGVAAVVQDTSVTVLPASLVSDPENATSVSRSS